MPLLDLPLFLPHSRVERHKWVSMTYDVDLQMKTYIHLHDHCRETPILTHLSRSINSCGTFRAELDLSVGVFLVSILHYVSGKYYNITERKDFETTCW